MLWLAGWLAARGWFAPRKKAERKRRRLSAFLPALSPAQNNFNREGPCMEEARGEKWKRLPSMPFKMLKVK